MQLSLKEWSGLGPKDRPCVEVEFALKIEFGRQVDSNPGQRPEYSAAVHPFFSIIEHSIVSASIIGRIGVKSVVQKFSTKVFPKLTRCAA
jgi:hypothetical protein